MDYFAGLDISMDETHICVVDRDGAVAYEGKSASTAEAIAHEWAKAPSCRRILFETGRMAPILFHGLSQLGVPVVCIESRQSAAIDDPSQIRRSRDVGAYLGLVPGDISPGRSTTSAASRNAATDGCRPSCTKPPTSC